MESLRASGSGGIGRQSRAGGDGVEAEANESIDIILPFFCSFLTTYCSCSRFVMPDAMELTHPFSWLGHLHCIVAIAPPERINSL